MRKFWLTMAFVPFVLTTAQAADLPARTYTKAPVMAPVYSWTGFYIGGDVGGVSQTGSGTSNFFQAVGALNNVQGQSPSSSSVIGGIHAGYNWQFAPSFLLGIEADAQWMDPKSGFCRQTQPSSLACTDTGQGFVTINSESKWLSTVRGRLGWTFDRFLVYGTGGVAFGEVDTSIGLNCSVNGCAISSNPFVGGNTTSSTRTGWVAGGGIEWMFASNWSVRAEYLHADLGNLTATFVLPAANCGGVGPCGVTSSRNFVYDIGRVGLSYKLGG